MLNGQSKIKGELINEFGENGWAEILLNGKPTKWMNYDGKIDLETSQKGLNEITLKYFGHITTKIKVDCNEDFTDLGKIYLISGYFWLDGPKNGFITETYESGLPKYKVGIKNWKLNGESDFYDKNGVLTQKLLFKKGKLLKIQVRENDKLKDLKFEFTKNDEIITVYNN